MTCRNVSKWRRNWADCLVQDKVEGIPADCSIGVRHKGGVTLTQASVRNVGTCRPDVKEVIQADNIRKAQSTDAGHRGGEARIRDESPVMGLDRRSLVARLQCEHNLRG
jgi:hypothetical protein